MLLTHNDMLNSPVAAADIGERIGSIAGMVAEAEDHRILAFIVKESAWFSSPKFLSPEDVIEYDPQAVIVSSADTLVPQKEIVRAEKLLQSREQILKRKVVTKSGEHIGVVTNFAIDTETACITRYYVHALFGQERIIPTKSIVKVTKDSFVIADSKKAVKHEQHQPHHGVPKIA